MYFLPFKTSLTARVLNPFSETTTYSVHVVSLFVVVTVCNVAGSLRLRPAIFATGFPRDEHVARKKKFLSCLFLSGNVVDRLFSSPAEERSRRAVSSRPGASVFCGSCATVLQSSCQSAGPPQLMSVIMEANG